MNRINTLSDLLVEELADLLDVENQLAKVLPKMADASQMSALKNVLENHLEITKKQAHRLRDIFSLVGQNARAVTCEVMKRLIRESEELVTKIEKCQVRDAAIVNLWQRVEQYEITKYKIAREHADDLGHTKIVELLTSTLNEERAMNFHLNELAQYMINVQAIEPKSRGGFYIPEGKSSRKHSKKRNTSKDVSRFISERNPNTQDQNPQNPEEQGELS